MKHTKKSTMNYLGIKNRKSQKKQLSHENANETLAYLGLKKRKTTI